MLFLHFRKIVNMLPRKLTAVNIRKQCRKITDANDLDLS